MTEARAFKGTKLNDRFVFNDDDTFEFVHAGDGDDYISDAVRGNFWSNDCYNGNRGNDTLISTAGHDVLRGGRGDDTFEVTVGWYDKNAVPGSWPGGSEPELAGFNAKVFGGSDHDVLTIHNSEGYTVEYVNNLTIIHTNHGGTITVKDVEEIFFL